MNQLESVKELLALNEYGVKACVSDSGSVTLELPERKFSPKAVEQHISYTPKYGEEPGIFIDAMDSFNNEQSMFVDCPPYAARLMIFCDIINWSLSMEFNVSLIDFVHKDKHVKHKEFLGSIKKPPKNFRKQEKALTEIYETMTQDISDPSLDIRAKQGNVFDGYSLLKTKVLEGFSPNV